MDSENNMQQNNKRKRDRRQWSKEEGEAFLDILIEAVNLGQRCDTRQFKPHTLRAAETKLELKFPRCGIKVDNDDVWNEYVKVSATPLFNKLAFAFGRDRATGKENGRPGDVVEELDREEEEQNGIDDNGVDLTQSPSITRPQSHSRKRNRGANVLADSLLEVGNNLAKMIEVGSGKLAKAARDLKSDKAFDDSRNLMIELSNMDLTEQEIILAGDKILSVPHRLHLFWGLNGAARLTFVKSLI
ncbi:hypothetical protein SESBI_27060 [Sesbania bispinosa]|nr:hypothetical protein SESBI_27060 [Sesbania bispinosa]